MLAVYFSFEMYYRFKIGLKPSSYRELHKIHKEKFCRLQDPVSVHKIFIIVIVIVTAIMLLILLTVQVSYTSDLPLGQYSHVSSYFILSYSMTLDSLSLTLVLVGYFLLMQAILILQDTFY